MTTCPSPIPIRPKRKRSSSLSTHPTRLHTIDESKHDDVEMYMESHVNVADDGSVSPSSSLSPSSPLTSSSPRRVTSPTKRTHLTSPKRHTQKTLLTSVTDATPVASPPITVTSHVIPPPEISLPPSITGNDVDVLPTASPVLITSVSASAASSSSSVPKSAFRPTSAASTSTPTLTPLLSPPHTLLAEIRHLALIDGMCLRSDIAQYFARFAAPLAPYGIMRRMKWMGEDDDEDDISPPSVLPTTPHHLTSTPFHSHNYHHRIQHQIFTQITTSSRSRTQQDRSAMKQMNGSLRRTVIDLTTSTSTTTAPTEASSGATSSLPIPTSLPVDTSMTHTTTSPQPVLISPTPLATEMVASLSAASTPSFSLPTPIPTTTSSVTTATASATMTTGSPSVNAASATNVAATASTSGSVSSSSSSSNSSSSSSSSSSATSSSTSSSSSQSSSARFRSYSFPHSLIIIPEMSDDTSYYESKYNHDTTHHNTLSFYRYQPESTSALQGGSHRAYYNQHHQQQQQQQHQQLIAKKIKVMKKQKEGIASGLNASSTTTSSVDPTAPSTSTSSSSSSSSSTRPRSTFINPGHSTQSVLSFLCDLQHELITIQSIITSYNIPDHKLAKAILKWHQQWKYGHHYHTQIRKYAYRKYAKENKQKQHEEKKEGDGLTSTSSSSSSTSTSSPVSGASLLTSPFTIPPARFDCSLLFSSSSRPHAHTRHHSRDIYPTSYTPSSTISNWNMYDTPIVRPHATRSISPTSIPSSSISCDSSMSTSPSISSSTSSSITTTTPPMSKLELCILRLLWFIHVRSLLHGVTQPFMLHIMLDSIMKKQHTMSSFFTVLMKFERSLMERLIFPHLRADNLYEIQRLSYGCDPSIFQQLQWKGCQALHVAAGYNAYHTLSWLLDTCHIDINLRSFLDDATPLIIACEMGAILTARILLMRGCYTLAVDRAGLTALHRAAIYGHVALIPLLIQYMQKYVDTEMASGVASACISLQPHPTHHHDDDGQPSLKRHRPDIDLTQDESISIPDIVCASGLTALHYAILKKNVGCVKALVRMGADINKKMHNDQGLHPALLAIRERSLEIFEFLLDHPSMDRNACTEMDIMTLQQSENVTITIGPVQHMTEMIIDNVTSPPPLITPSTITPTSAALSSPSSASSSTSSLPPVTIPGRSSPHPAPFHMRSSSPLAPSPSNLISPLALQAPSHMMSWSHLLNTSIPIHSSALPPIPIRMNASSEHLPSITRVPSLQRAHTFSFGAGTLVSRSSTSTSSASSSSSSYHIRPASPIPTPIRPRIEPMQMSVTFNIPRSLTPGHDSDTDMSMDLSLQIDGTQMQSFTLPIPHIISSSSSSSSHVHTSTR